jgi:hypothetical protein
MLAFGDLLSKLETINHPQKFIQPIVIFSAGKDKEELPYLANAGQQFTA